MPGKEPIAIVGMGCRFPGANNLKAFWQLLFEGTDAIKEIPVERFDVDEVYDPTPGSAGKLITRWGGFLDDVDQFDPYFFGISPREAARMDPQQRLLLEVAWEAFEDAGLPVEKLAGSNTGVFIGMSTNDYEDLAFADRESVDLYMMTGCSRAVASGRLSYVLDLQGPSMTIDTACSSSLVAVHLACQSIWNGESSLALAGGSNLVLEPEQGLGFSKMGLLSPDGRCKTFDARADGFVRSEGVGTVILKPLSQALADRDPIYCVIRGSAVNNDGRTSGLLVTPGQKSQEDVLRKAYLDAGVAPELVQYVETHGTGTIVGDRVEVTAIGRVCGEKRSADQACLIGSVKTNIGHTEGAAGIAGLIKVALSLKHGIIPPNLHLQQLHPNLPLQELNLRVPQQVEHYQQRAGRPALAGVSSFGISATNAHMVLEQAPLLIHSTHQEVREEAQLLTLSAKTPEALSALAYAYQTELMVSADTTVPMLADICYTASCRRSHHHQRLAVFAQSTSHLLEQLQAFLQQKDQQGIGSGSVPARRPKIVYVFPGQGSQWLKMGRNLVAQEPVFRETLQQCELMMRPYVDWSLLDIVTTNEDPLLLQRIDIVQPTLMAIQLGLAAVWNAWGIQPDAVIGHSMGEVAAAVVAGALSMQDALQIICQRSLLLKRVAGQGCMAVVDLSLEEAQQWLVGKEEQISIATSNGPNSTVLSGDVAAIEQLMSKLQAQKIYCSLIKVDVASHSPQMDPLLAELRQSLMNIRSQEARIPFYSTVIGAPLEAEQELDACYWAQNLRQPVLFFSTVQRLLQDGYSIFLEISAHPILMAAVQKALQVEKSDGSVICSLRRDMDEREILLQSLGELYVHGIAPDWDAFYATRGQYVSLPSYQWQREKYWLSEHELEHRLAHTHGLRAQKTVNHLLDDLCLTSAARPGEYVWAFDLSSMLFPYLSDHRIQGRVVLPATAYLECVLAATKEIFGVDHCAIEDIAFKQVLFLPDDGVQHVQLIIAPAMPGLASFQFFSLQGESSTTHSQWELHVSGTLLLNQQAQESMFVDALDVARIQKECSRTLSGAQHYRNMERQGLEYGSNFQGIEQIWQGYDDALCQVQIVPALRANIDKYQFHPALFDACLQAVLAALPHYVLDDEEAGAPIVPVGIGHLKMYQQARTALWSYARVVLKQPEGANQYKLSWQVLDEAGQLVLEASDVCLQRLAVDASSEKQEEIADWLYEIQWHGMQEKQEKKATDHDRGSWLIFADRVGVAQQVAEFLEMSGDQVVFVYPGDEYQEMTHLAQYQLHPTRPEEFHHFFATIKEAEELPPCHGILHFWSLEAAPSLQISSEQLKAAELLGCASTLHIIQAIEALGWSQIPRLWLVTNGVQAIGSECPPVAVAQAPLWGLGRTIVYEHPELRCVRVDLSVEIRTTEIQSLFQSIYADESEDQIALRGKQRYAARLEKVEPGSLNTRPSSYAFNEPNPLLAEARPCRIEVPLPGSLDNLRLGMATRPQPAKGEIEIQVSAAGLNFKDVLFALGMLDYQDGAVHFGHECAGRITALGEGVEGFRIGDEVIAVGAPACFSRFVLKPATFVLPKPRQLNFAEAASTPLVFLTAYYSLCHVGRLTRGERILIHAASGGVGLAAVQIAQWIGAEIFATAGSPEKRQFLRELGIQHVLDSRSLSFVDEIFALTAGQGVDVVLNSLAGEALTRSFSLLANHGRFLELGKKDIQLNNQLSLSPFERNLSFSAIDISLLLRERPHIMVPLLHEILHKFENRTFTPLPTSVFPLTETVEAFRFLAQARHIGKIAISFEAVPVEDAVYTALDADLFNAQSSYLITGGLGGLGLTIVQWMVEQGARHFVLVGRSAPSANAATLLAALKAQDVDILVSRTDITQVSQVADMLSQVKASMPPLRGILHAAAILKDGILLQTDVARLQEVLAPKVQGAWNLHQQTIDVPLDFFVLFSSTASLIGLPGQGNYSAANAFLDALAHHRKALGLPALSINWGAWSEVGLAAAQANRGGRLAQRGIKSIPPQQGLETLALLLRSQKEQIGAMPFDIVQWQQFYPSVSNSAMFAGLLERKQVYAGTAEAVQEQKTFTLDLLLAETERKREELLQTYLSKQIARILRIPVAKLDIQRSLHTLGIDSLMAVELKNQIESDIAITVPVVLLLQGITILQLSEFLASEIVGTSESDEVELIPGRQNFVTEMNAQGVKPYK
ncbi:polyketide synthase [Dictyobacter alpinus]|uniref:Polyketide synthase n=1 Tax=Dictyobacter alpinus TaxID=2014873 RepID=A0A402BG82_9CHLR|nr:type I polyketide synthase [Dictyobacter alpinus]GCE30404.1 polyketide synthase [Dictyobacter alpinus]